MKKHKQIFFDTGSRWKRVKIAGAILLIINLCVLAVIGYSFYEAPFLPMTKEQTEKIDKDIEDINNVSRPVVGEGTFVKLANLYGKDYLKREGEGKKVVALTFDDGPDPRYTPRIVDILKKENVHATFFMVGRQLYNYPEAGRYILDQGSDIGLHTFSHTENKNDRKLGFFTFVRELGFTEKLFEHFYGYRTTLFRVPYVAMEDKLSYDALQYIREAEKRGLTVSTPTVDSEDWLVNHDYKKIVQLATTSEVQTPVILFHDAGGERDATVKALPEVIHFYKARGYEFTTISEMARENGFTDWEPISTKEKIIASLAFYVYDIYKKSPHILEKGFILGYIFVLLHISLFLVMACIGKARSAVDRRRSVEKGFKEFNQLVSVIIPMYNEERSIRPAIRSILKSSYHHLEVIVVDDGSTDRSLSRAEELMKDKRVRVFTKPNGGKHTALNYGLRSSKGKIVVFVDADTRLERSALKKIVNSFHDRKVGAVAGNIKVGNKKGFLAWLQSLEYTLGQSVDKRVTDLFGVVMVVPGAFGAWRKSAIKKAGGFSRATHSEDFDLTMAIIKEGYTVKFCEDAIAHTEAPLTLRQFFKQRFRWNFGNLQVYYKYRSMLFNKKYGMLGMVFLPRTVFIQIPSFILTPMIDIFVLMNLLWGERTLTLFFLLFYFILQLASISVAYILMRQRFDHPLALLFFRFPYTQFLYIAFFLSLIRAVKGEVVTWNKLHHTGKLNLANS